MKYYAMIEGRQCGPYELEQLPRAGVRPSTYVWCEGMPDWEKAEDVADICRLFRNRLYDLMHPAPNAEVTEKGVIASTGENRNYTSPDMNISPTRFDRYLQDQQQPSLPTIEEIDSMENTEVPPANMIGYAWIVTLFCCPLTGIPALVLAYKSRNLWKEGKKKEAHEYCRGAKLWTGVSFFIGIIVYAFILRFFIL